MVLVAAAFPALALDRDGDGVDDTHDCAPLISATWAIAGEIAQLEWVDRDDIAWDPEPLARWYDVYRGTIPEGSSFDYTHGCWTAHRPTTAVTDEEEPAPGALFYYLISAANECGEGSLGDGFAGPRTPDDACPPSDGDGDGVPDRIDLCPYVADSAQDDADLDAIGTACDVCPWTYDPLQQNDDGDGFGSVCDNCPASANADQANVDGDAWGDACDPCAHDPGNDADSDGVCGDIDNCPALSNSDQANADGDALGDACDACPDDPANDVDGDAVCGNLDNCPAHSNADQANADGDARGDACDVCVHDSEDDVDGDGVCGDIDNCVLVPNTEQTNADGDGFGDVCDSCIHDAANDGDHDGVCADVDNCPTAANSEQADSDGDGLGDACDVIAVIDIHIVDQDVRSDFPNMAQHRQQASSRLGRRNGARFRTMAWFDVSTLPAQANIRSVTIVYHTTSGDPADIDTNGDSAPLGGPITIEVREILKPWNQDEPLTYPAILSDNEVNATNGETSWRYALYPAQWEVAGAQGALDSGPAIAWTTVTSAIDARFEFTSSGLADMVQRWVSGTAPNHGVLLRAADSDENAAADNRKIFCGKGFPLETSTGLPLPVAESHRPFVRIEYDFP